MKNRLTCKLGALLWSAVLLSTTNGHAQTVEVETPEANPGRPTVSTPATLTPVGYLQFENGSLYATHSREFDTRFSINQVTRFTLNSRLQLLLLSEPFVHDTLTQASANNPGEVFAGLQTVLLTGEGSRPTLSINYIARLHESPAPELDIGTFRQSATLLLSDDLLGFHFDLNGMLLEQAQGSIRRAQYGQSLSLSHPIKALTVSAELWHFSQPLTNGNAIGNLWAFSYPIRKNLVIDCGFDHGLTSTSTQWEGFTGFTYLLPHRFWKTRDSKHK